MRQVTPRDATWPEIQRRLIQKTNRIQLGKRIIRARVELGAPRNRSSDIMNVTAISANDLTDDHVAQWRLLQAENPSCAGPHFSVEFVKAVAEVRDHIEVAMMSRGGEPFGFVPFRRTKGDIGRPIADNFSDFQGCIVSPNVCWDADEIVRRCRLNAFHFSNVPATCAALEPFVWQSKQASYIDLSEGFEAYRVSRRKAGSDELHEALRKVRKIQRDVAPLHFEPRSTDPAVFRTLIAWKRAQLKARNLGDSFAGPWVLPLLERIVNSQTDDFTGMMSVLRVGDEILAINLGMRSRNVLHGWVTTYNRDFAKYSPGMMMVVQLAQYAERQGVRRIEMGGGGEAFKMSLASGTYDLVSGAIDLRPVAKFATHGWMLAKEMIRDTPLEATARAAFRQLRQASLLVAPSPRDA